MPGKGRVDAIFGTRQLMQKYEKIEKEMYFVIVYLEKAFNCVPREVIWWA